MAVSRKTTIKHKEFFEMDVFNLDLIGKTTRGIPSKIGQALQTD